MGQTFKRNLVFNINKYQTRVIYPVLVSCIIACCLAVICLAYFYYPADLKIVLDLKLDDLKFYIPWLLLTICLIMVFITFRTYYISNKLLGPFVRIMRELDDVIEGKRKNLLGVRKGDEMFEEILKRINSLIKKLP
ncbi:MAG TPA: hypothetical protein DD723_01630 [Candidatus Omnitrophica bacterium]|nr:MAG: hypothetical protein A2Z81_04455 [Omnitrophica WOR_2 bacterium GWA2_45_18]OGX19808.1 MAG: hypothetical protein A2Y04_02085 [Omnitrophica WOR_2 bacterium GWC2_45_7]HBR14232.1 hypothetical protein [Candidatus Omnitrophota bacterium]